MLTDPYLPDPKLSYNKMGGVVRPRVDWWVRKDNADRKTILGELEHVSRDLWSASEPDGDVAVAIRKFNANPNAAGAEKALQKAREDENHWHIFNLHNSPNRHDTNKNATLSETMTSVEIQNAIRDVQPREDPRGAYLPY